MSNDNTRNGSMKTSGSRSLACSNCRQRKMKCNGLQPCHSCTQGRIPMPCEYIDTSRPAIPMLPKNAACIPCRKKKKKCNAARPFCSTCAVGFQKDRCVYDDRSQSAPTISSDSRSTSEESSPMTELPRYQSAGELSRDSYATPQEPELPWLSSCLGHAHHLGIIFSDQKKLKALQIGDLSGNYIHPSIVYIVQLWDCVHRQRVFTSPSPDREQMHLQLAISSLENTSDPLRLPNVVEQLQATCFLGVYFFYRQDMGRCKSQMDKMAQLILEHELHIFDLCRLDVPVETSEESRAVCQALFFDHSPHNPFKFPTHLSEQLIREFDTLLLLRPDLTLHDICFIRTAASLDFNRSRYHGLLHITAPDLSPAGPWVQGYHCILGPIYTHIACAKSMWKHAVEAYEKANVIVALKFCTVILLSSTLHLQRIATCVEEQRKSVDAALEIVDISASFQPEEIEILDPLILVCWAEVAVVLQEAQERSPVRLSFADQLATLQRCERDVRALMPFE